MLVINTVVLLPTYKILAYSYEEDIQQISSGRTNHNTFLEIFVGIAFQLGKVSPTFSSFNPCPFLPSVAIDGFHCHQELIKGTEKASPIHTLFHR